MVKKWKIPLVMIVAAALIAVPCGGVLAQENPYEKDRDPGAMTADLVLTRPVGLAAIVAGTAVFVLSIPFSVIGGNTGQAWQKLVMDPIEYTFVRPLGEF
jgi:hypothetical protein